MALTDLLTRDDLPEDVHEAIRHHITELEVAEHKQTESFSLLAEAEKLSKTGAWQWNIAGDTWRFSNEWVAIHGCRTRHLSSEELLALAHPEDRERIAAAFEDVTTKSDVYDVEHRIIRPDTGAIRVIHSRGRLVRDTNGEPLRVVGAAQDVTEFNRSQEQLEQYRDHLEELVEERTKQLREEFTQRQQVETALREKEEHFRIAQEISPDGFTVLRPVCDDQGCVVDFTWVYENDTVARLNGTDPKAVVDQRLLDLFPGHAGSTFFKAYQHVAETGEQRIFEDEYQGETIENSTWFRIVVVPTGTDIAIFAQDITDRKRAEEEREKLIVDLSEADERLKKLRGIVPICTHCKKIRDDQEFWRQVEVYIQDQTEAEFSHGLCVPCAESFYDADDEGIPDDVVDR